MGSTNPSSTCIKVQRVGLKQLRFKNEELKGEMTPETQQQVKIFEKYMKNLPLDSFIVTEKNVQTKRKEMEQGAKILEEREKDYFASHMNQVNISYD